MDSVFKRVFIIAEIGMNHNGSLALAKELVDAAVASRVDAIKFQTHIFAAESLPDAPAPKYFTTETRKDFFERTAFVEEQWKELKEYVKIKGVDFISSPFSIEAIDLLERVGVDAYKVPSGEVTNVVYLEAMAKTGRPIFLSTGMNNWAEIDRAVKTIMQFNEKLAILQCTSSYPCNYNEVGLNVIQEIKHRYNLPVGLSDHTLTIFASLAAVSLGAKIIERHFTLSRKLYGPDATFSLEPDEMKLLVQGIRAIEIMISSNVDKNDIAKLSEIKKVFEKSIVTKIFIPQGTIITRDMLTYKKPGDGIRADKVDEIIGKVAKINIKENTKILKEYLNEK